MLQRWMALNDASQRAGPVVYWMNRDQRAQDNAALLRAQARAIERHAGLVVVFCRASAYLGATAAQYDFMLAGLREVRDRLAALGIPFVARTGYPVAAVTAFVEEIRAGLVVSDFNPLRLPRLWKSQVAERVGTRFGTRFEIVDAHNVIPCWAASDKQEFAARTFRPKVHRLLPEYLTDFPVLVTHPFPVPWSATEGERMAAETAEALVSGRGGVVAEPGRAGYGATHILPGEDAATAVLKDFLAHRLVRFGERNDPDADACSGLSPYLHFGQISAQRVAWEAAKRGEAVADPDASLLRTAVDAFLEELLVRRELADNYCWYNEAYDRPEGFPDWARRTLEAHGGDPREARYDLERLEQAATHDRLCNAAQQEMALTGRMHGYLRMYWAKRILAWSGSAEEAQRNAIALNDRYSLDGRDPNGYAGIAWSVGGVHDRPWGERPVFGLVRTMTEGGCRRKFDVERYIRRIDTLGRGAAE